MNMSDENNMDSVVLLPIKRRRSDLNWQLCIICQTIKPDESVSDGSVQGIDRVKEACEIRLNHKDTSYESTLDRLVPFINSLPDKIPKWHKICYASFTSKINLQRIIKRHQPEQPRQHEVVNVPATLTRQTVPQVRTQTKLS